MPVASAQLRAAANVMLSVGCRMLHRCTSVMALRRCAPPPWAPATAKRVPASRRPIGRDVGLPAAPHAAAHHGASIGRTRDHAHLTITKSVDAGSSHPTARWARVNGGHSWCCAPWRRGPALHGMQPSSLIAVLQLVTTASISHVQQQQLHLASTAWPPTATGGGYRAEHSVPPSAVAQRQQAAA
jgi:hypothetical protein